MVHIILNQLTQQGNVPSDDLMCLSIGLERHMLRDMK